MAKIGIMGGTFNPIHNVHLIMAEEARRQFGLNEVWFMPSGTPPHKDKRFIASGEHRKRMIQHAIQENPHFEFSDLEIKRDGITYTRDTLRFLRKKMPQDAFYFILGGDSLAQMDSWCDPAYIFENCHVLAANREETENGEIQKWISFYEKKYNAKISEIQMPSITISSEMIRNKIQSGKSVSDYCPAVVERYIRLNGLYGISDTGFTETPSETELIQCLLAVLKPRRFIHTLGVAVTAANLAGVHGCDTKQAYLAGLLHDCAKYLTSEEQMASCQSAGISLSDIEQKNPALIHGKLGAYFARTKYKVSDKEIISAITWHTTGRPDMTLLEKIIYVADYMEPGRNMDCMPFSLEQIRRAAFAEIDEALLMVLTCCVGFLDGSGKPIDPMTLKTYEYYQR